MVGYPSADFGIIFYSSVHIETSYKNPILTETKMLFIHQNLLVISQVIMHYNFLFLKQSQEVVCCLLSADLF